MRAVILAGGQGSRLRPYTTVVPKPLLPVGDRPILELIARQLHRSGFDRLDISVGHLGGLIQAYFADESNRPAGMELDYHWEDEPLGTAGALHQIPGLEGDFLAMNGDILTTLDYGELMSFHREQGAALTIATHQTDVHVQLGVIESEGTAVTGYVEKPTMHYRVSMGIYVYNESALEHIPRERFDFPDVVRALLDAGKPVAAYPFEGTWFDIGTFGDFEKAAAEIARHPELFLGPA